MFGFPGNAFRSLGFPAGVVGGGAVAFVVLDSDGNSFQPSFSVLDSDGNAFTVPANVLDSDGNSFAVTTA